MLQSLTTSPGRGQMMERSPQFFTGMKRQQLAADDCFDDAVDTGTILPVYPNHVDSTLIHPALPSAYIHRLAAGGRQIGYGFEIQLIQTPRVSVRRKPTRQK